MKTHKFIVKTAYYDEEVFCITAEHKLGYKIRIETPQWSMFTDGISPGREIEITIND